MTVRRTTRELEAFDSAAGRRIYKVPVRSFPNLVTNVYFVDDGDGPILVDTGSGYDHANADLEAGVAELADAFGVGWGLVDLRAILITHGHIDHFGGLPFVRRFSDAPVGVHALDRRTLSNHDERVVFASRRLDTYLSSAGVPAEQRQTLLQVYLFGKAFYQSTPVQFTLAEGTPAPGEIAVYHVPGHCPGQVCLRVDDILLTADHVLARTTPHQAPESITNNMGLGHYLDALDKIGRLDGISLALGGHEEAIPDLNGRIEAIKGAHEERLARVLDICRTPQSIADVSRVLFGPVESYHILLALEEAGAHVEYLYQRGELVAANVAEIATTSQPVIRYQRG